MRGSERGCDGESLPLVSGVVVVKKGGCGRLGRGAKREDDVFMGPAVRGLSDSLVSSRETRDSLPPQAAARGRGRDRQMHRERYVCSLVNYSAA